MSTSISSFDPAGARLHGMQVIEASAGTGKTWTITGLYLRLVLEQGLPVSRILVVTFTKAATAELRDRIRSLLIDAARALETRQTDNPLLAAMLARLDEDEERARAGRRCRAALQQLDEAAIFTIHSFCQRALEDAAFDSGTAFRREVESNDRGWKLACIEDFWRRKLASTDREFLEFLVTKKKLSPEKLLDAVGGWTSKPYLLLREAEDPDKQDEERLGRLRQELLEWLDQEMPRRKAEARRICFDDLLLDLRAALNCKDRGNRLAARLRERFSAALIDEFQDTDPIQYKIFERIYAGSDLPVFLVGDPKQAIYGFRGADIFAYLGAREQAAESHTLSHNWRSEPRLINAVNQLFSAAPDPFVFPQIAFQAATAAPKERPEASLLGMESAPLEVWIPGDGVDGNEELNADVARASVAKAVAGRIRNLLDAGRSGEAHIGEEGVEGRHIAVLVKTHKEAEEVRRALAAVGVAAVRVGSGNVFASREAQELERVLMAIAEPGQERRIRGALATSFHEFDAAAIYKIAQTDRDWDDLQESFRRWRETWQSAGAATMFAQWMEEMNVVGHLLASVEGERALTNLLHLLELLRAEAQRQHQSIERLVAWLAERRSEASDRQDRAPEEHLLRLESDENLVEIVTVHSSKGLEYDIVFCPYTFTGRSRRAQSKPLVGFHDPDAGWQSVLDFGSAEKERARECAENEERAESLRLLYVALTRARRACVCSFGPVKGAHNSALGWLLRSGEEAPASVVGSGWEEVLAAAAERSEGAIRVRSVSDVVLADEACAERLVASGEGGAAHDESVDHQARRLSRRVRASRWTTSFSQLARGRGADLRDRDTHEEPAADGAGSFGHDIFAFPRGAKPGVCLHKIFETVDFAEAESDARAATTRRILGQFGYGEEWAPAVSKMVEDVLATALDESGTIRLADISRAARLDEAEFHYPAARVTLGDLNTLLTRHGLPALSTAARDGDLPTPLTQGYLKGYIDLLFEADGRFYLADYKSNWLGARVEDYRAARLPAVMEEHLYTIQYLAYSIALHRMLGQRIAGYDYEQHFGGVRYLFVRGMRPELGVGHGVFAHRPPQALVEEFDARLRG